MEWNTLFREIGPWGSFKAGSLPHRSINACTNSDAWVCMCTEAHTPPTHSLLGPIPPGGHPSSAWSCLAMGPQLTAPSIADISPVVEWIACSQTVPCRLSSHKTLPIYLGRLSAGQRQGMLRHPWNFILELCRPVERFVLMEMFCNVYCLIWQPGDACDLWAFDM